MTTVTNTKFTGNEAYLNRADSAGGAIWNAGTINLTATEENIISGNKASNGGAVYNSGTLNITGGENITFSNNGLDSLRWQTYGGAIYNTSTGTITGLDGVTFVGNKAGFEYNKGGAIANEGLISGGIQNATFTSNAGPHGGAIWNTAKDGKALVVNNSTFTTNHAASKYTDQDRSEGGAIFNSGTITLQDSQFTGNTSHIKGGAIYNSGTTNIAAATKDVIFTGNKNGVTYAFDENNKITGVTGGTYNDIYNTSTVNLKAASGKSITFGGTIEGDNGTVATINLNNDATIKGGNYVFNNTVSGNTVKFYNGAQAFLGSQAQADSNTSYGLLNVKGLTNDANGGNIDSRNAHIESNTLGAVTLGSDMTLQIDADLAVTDATKRADNFTGSSITDGTSKFIINNITAISDNSQNYIKAFEANANLKARFALSQMIINVTSASGVLGTYRAQYLANEGYLIFIRDDIKNLVTVTRNEYGFDGTTRTYTLKSNENIANELDNYGASNSYATTSIGAMGSSNVTINAGTHTVSGGNRGGITIGSGYTYAINGGTWTGFNGNVFDNAGTLNVAASDNNATVSNAVKNTNALNIDAASDKIVTMGVVSDAATPSGTLTINNAATANTGTVNFNDSVTQKDMSIARGTVGIAASNLKIRHRGTGFCNYRHRYNEC